MFKCRNCSRSSQRPNRVVLEYRMHEHDASGRGPRGSRGPQIVRETVVCDACLSTTPAAVKPEAVEVSEPLRASASEAA